MFYVKHSKGWYFMGGRTKPYICLVLFRVERCSATKMGASIRRSIAVVNQKGGVGKTTTAVNLAAGLALAGHQTLIVDLDPQGNATTGLGVKKEGLYPTIYHVLLGSEPPHKATVGVVTGGLNLLPSDIDLVGAEIELVGLERREYRLREALEAEGDGAEYVIIDSPPSLGLLTINALVAADRVLVPLQCEFYALEGLAHLVKTIKLVRERLNPGLKILGIVLTPSHGRPVMLHDVRSNGAIAYLELTKEVLRHE